MTNKAKIIIGASAAAFFGLVLWIALANPTCTPKVAPSEAVEELTEP